MSNKANCLTPCCCTPVTPPPAPCDDCFYAHGTTILPPVSIGPCGQEAYIDLAVLNAESSCDGPITYIVHDYNKTAFSKVWLDGTILRWRTSDTAVPGCFYKIFYIAKCAAEDERSIARILVGIKDECQDVPCDDGFKCDKCDGLCKPLTSDLSVEIQDKTDLGISIEELS